MKYYVKDSLVIVNNPFENKTFIFDRKTKLEYDINEDTFDILLDIKNNSYNLSQLNEMYGDEFISQIISLGLITKIRQNNINNIKKVENYNFARIYVELTDTCNLCCKHCYGGFASNRNTYLKLEDLELLLKDAASNGVYQFDLTGGEPMLYPYFDELLKLAYENGMLVRIFTNLTLCDNKMIDTLLKYGIREIVTSIDSSIPCVHDNFRGKKGSFDKTVSTIDLLKKKGINVAVNTMIGKHNADHINELVNFINKLKVRSVLDVIVPEGRAKQLEENIIDSSALIRDVYKNNINNIDSNAISISCGVGNRFLYVKSDGNIYICPSLINDEYKLGNIKNSSVFNLWENMNKKFSHLTCNKKTNKCKNCTGGCRARALKLHHSVYAEDDVYCVVNEVGCTK